MDGDYWGICPQCGGSKFYLAGFENPQEGANACANCGYRPKAEDFLRQRLEQVSSLLKVAEDTIKEMRLRITLRNRQIRDLRRVLRK